MKILFVGDASAAHYNLAEGLRRLGHEALVISHGGQWRNHPCDISISRDVSSMLSSLLYVVRWLLLLPRFRGYDVVQFVGALEEHVWSADHPDLIKVENDVTAFE